MNEFLKIGDHEEDVDRTRQANKLSVLFYPRSLQNGVEFLINIPRYFENDDSYYMFRSYINCYYSSSEPVTDEEDEL